jgi:hypothetical protein
MKKVFFVLVLMMSVVVMNAQTAKTTTPVAKSTHAAFSVADLPKAVTDNIAKDYPGFTVKDAKTKTAKSGLEYVVAVVKGTESKTLLFDKAGKFLKEEAPKVAAAHHEKKKK